MVDEALARGDPGEAYRLMERRLDDALALVAAEPNNWKYVYNLSHAYYYAIAIHCNRRELDEARECAVEMVRLARELRRLQPNRQDFIIWYMHACGHAEDVARRLGDPEAELSYASLAFSTAVDLAYGAADRADHLERVLAEGTRAARLSRAHDNGDFARHVLARMRDVLALARTAQAPPAALEALAAGVKAIEGE